MTAIEGHPSAAGSEGRRPAGSMGSAVASSAQRGAVRGGGVQTAGSHAPRGTSNQRSREAKRKRRARESQERLWLILKSASRSVTLDDLRAPRGGPQSAPRTARRGAPRPRARSADKSDPSCGPQGGEKVVSSGEKGRRDRPGVVVAAGEALGGAEVVGEAEVGPGDGHRDQEHVHPQREVQPPRVARLRRAGIRGFRGSDGAVRKAFGGPVDGGWCELASAGRRAGPGNRSTDASPARAGAGGRAGGRSKSGAREQGGREGGREGKVQVEEGGRREEVGEDSEEGLPQGQAAAREVR